MSLEAYRSCGTLSSGHAVTTLALPNVETDVVCSKVPEYLPIHYSDDLLDALQWSTGVNDRGILVGLANELHEVVRDEHIRKHARAKLQDSQTDTAEPKA